MNETIDAFRAIVKNTDRSECWPWKMQINDAGYGIWKGKRAHRVAYELFIGPIPDGLVLDHLCRNRCCVNPYHLEPVTNAENVRRAYRMKDKCKNGHKYTEENTYRRPSNPSIRMCRQCYLEKGREWKAKNPERVKEHRNNRNERRRSLSQELRRAEHKARYQKYKKQNQERARARKAKNPDEVNRMWREAYHRRKAKKAQAISLILQSLSESPAQPIGLPPEP